MPAIDQHHDIVVNALKKDGWTITHQQVRLVIDDRWLWIDIQAEKGDETTSVLIEVKGFDNPRSPVAYLESVVGQYVVYQIVLDYLEWEQPLYLAVPSNSFDDILGEEIGVEVIKQAGIKLLIFSVDEEKILEWKT